MKPTIENPKVFISYAWGSKEYQDKVLSFATSLQGDGIEVLFDKWDLKEGHDTYAYMERSVNDASVTGVIILLDPLYEEKANNRDGGVGTETQIISPEIYNNVTQEKFLPVVFERKKDGAVPKPSYLQGLLHFDLTIDDTYNSEYQRLVKCLYGVDIHKKPELGKMPLWVTTESVIESEKISKLQNLRDETNAIIQKDKFLDFLELLKKRIIEHDDFDKDILEKYTKLQSYRNDYLYLLKYSHSLSTSTTLIADWFEETLFELQEPTVYERNLKKTLLYEMFIYTVAYYYKQKDYDSIKLILSKTYNISEDEVYSFAVFYAYNSIIDSAVKERDNKNYYSGLAKFFVESFNPLLFSIKEFCFADELCFNYIEFGLTPPGKHWFPITYIYDGEYNTLLKKFSSKLNSLEWAKVVASMLGYDDVTALKNKLLNKENEINNGRNNTIGYSMAFRKAPLLINFISSRDVAKYN